MGSLSLLQGIFPTQGLNPGRPHCGQILYPLSQAFKAVYLFSWFEAGTRPLKVTQGRTWPFQAMTGQHQGSRSSIIMIILFSDHGVFYDKAECALEQGQGRGRLSGCQSDYIR